MEGVWSGNRAAKIKPKGLRKELIDNGLPDYLDND
jgi:hypothetical protein